MLKKIITPIVLLLILLSFPCIALADANRHASSVTVSNLNAEADGKDKVLVTINLRDKTNKPEMGTVFIGTNRGGEIDNFWLRKDNQWVPVSALSKTKGDSTYYIDHNIIKANVDGKVELGISSKVKGDIKIAVGLKSERATWQYLSGHISEAEAEIIPVKYKDEKNTIENTNYSKLEISQKVQLETYTKNKVYLKILNASDEITSIASDIAKLELNIIVKNKPKEAQINVAQSQSWQQDLRETGSTYFTINSDKPGNIELNVSLKLEYDDSFSPDTVLTSSIKTNIKAKQFGAKEIILYINDNTAVVDNQALNLAVKPYIENGRTLVPVRFISEALGAKVEWYEKTKTIVLSRPDRKVTLNLNSNAVLLDNGNVLKSDVKPNIKNGYTVIPFRVIAEAFGAKVSAGFNSAGKVDKVIFYNN